MYEFITYTDNKDRKVILCLKRYKGKVIKGKAICHPEDTYNEEVGKLIAQKRCESHYLEKRIKEKYAYLKSKEIDWKQAMAEYDSASESFAKLCQVYAETQESLARELN